MPVGGAAGKMAVVFLQLPGTVTRQQGATLGNASDDSRNNHRNEVSKSRVELPKEEVDDDPWGDLSTPPDQMDWVWSRPAGTWWEDAQRDAHRRLEAPG